MIAGQRCEPTRGRGLQSELDHEEYFVAAGHALIAKARKHDGSELLLHDLCRGLVKVHSRGGQ